MVGGHAATYQGEAQVWPTMWVPSAAYLALAKAIEDEVPIPIFHATRITDAATASHAVKEGYLDMVGMTRAFIARSTVAARALCRSISRYRPILAGDSRSAPNLPYLASRHNLMAPICCSSPKVSG